MGGLIRRYFFLAFRFFLGERWGIGSPLGHPPSGFGTRRAMPIADSQSVFSLTRRGFGPGFFIVDFM